MYSTEWYIKDQVVLVSMSSLVTIADLQALNQEIINKYLTPAHHTIHLIVDGRAVTKLPNNLFEITKVSKPLSSNPNMGLAIYVQFFNPIMEFLANVVTQLLGQSYKIVNSIEEARTILHEQGSILSDLVE